MNIQVMAATLVVLAIVRSSSDPKHLKGFDGMVTSIEKSHLPAAGRDWALPLYDPLTRLFGINHVRKPLIENADLSRASRVLDSGCGTGTLAIAIKQRHPHLELVASTPLF